MTLILNIIRRCLYFVHLTTFYILGQKFVKFFVGFLGKSKISKRHSEINWPLVVNCKLARIGNEKGCPTQKVWNSWMLFISRTSKVQFVKKYQLCSPTLHIVISTFKQLQLEWIEVQFRFNNPQFRNGILFPKFFWPTVRKKYSSDQEKLLKFEAEGREFEIFWDH